MAAIVEVSGDRRLQLGAEELVRKFNFGGRWNKIRIGITMGINGFASTTGNWTLGVCSGTQGITAPLTVSYFGFTPTVGYGLDNSWTFNSGLSFQNASSNGYWSTKRGSTVSSTNNVGTQYFCAWAPNSLSWFSVTIKRTTWNTINGTVGHPYNAPQIAQFMPDWYFYKNMENETGVGYWGSADDTHSRTEALDALVEPLDSMSIVWNRAAPTFEIGNIGVIRFQ